MIPLISVPAPIGEQTASVGPQMYPYSSVILHQFCSALQGKNGCSLRGLWRPCENWRSYVPVRMHGKDWPAGPCIGDHFKFLLQLAPSTSAQTDRTGSPITWLSICWVRLMPMMPKTTKTMAPVSTRGRTAGFPQPVFTQGLKPKVAEIRALGTAEEGSEPTLRAEPGLLRLPSTP